MLFLQRFHRLGQPFELDVFWTRYAVLCPVPVHYVFVLHS